MISRFDDANCEWNIWALYKMFCVCVPALQIASLRVQAGDLGQEETVQKCLQNGAWVEGLFDRFGELINQVQQACRWSSLDFGLKQSPTLTNKRMPPAQNGSREGWSESLLPATERFESGICEPTCLKDISGALKWQQVNSRTAAMDMVFFAASQQKAETWSTEGKDIVFGSVLEYFHLMLLLVFLGFCSYKLTFMGLFIDSYNFFNLFFFFFFFS